MPFSGPETQLTALYTVKVDKNEQVMFNFLIYSASIFNLVFAVPTKYVTREFKNIYNYTISEITGVFKKGSAWTSPPKTE